MILSLIVLSMHINSFLTILLTTLIYKFFSEFISLYLYTGLYKMRMGSMKFLSTSSEELSTKLFP